MIDTSHQFQKRGVNLIDVQFSKEEKDILDTV